MAEKYRLRHDLTFTAEQYREGSRTLPRGSRTFEDDGERYPVVDDKDGGLVPLEHGDWVLEGADGLFVVSADNFTRFYEPLPIGYGGEKYTPDLKRVGARR